MYLIVQKSFEFKTFPGLVICHLSMKDRARFVALCEVPRSKVAGRRVFSKYGEEIFSFFFILSEILFANAEKDSQSN